jgi:hypothetical protein
MPPTAVQPQGEIRIAPWQPAAEVAESLGLSMAVFGYPGCGKTTFGAIPNTLVIDFEQGSEVLADRTDVMLWPRRDPNTGKVPKVTWDDFMALDRQLRSGNHPFKNLMFDTLTKAQSLTLGKVMKSSPTPEMPSQPEYGRSNTLLNDVIEGWCAIAKETGVNVIFNIHAAEVVEESGGVLIRMNLTPGVIKILVASVSAIGYLSEGIANQQGVSKRRLLLHNTTKVNAKFRQPRSGPQLPLELDDPSLQAILAHREKARDVVKAALTTGKVA